MTIIVVIIKIIDTFCVFILGMVMDILHLNEFEFESGFDFE
jgi:hypothetical protein